MILSSLGHFDYGWFKKTTIQWSGVKLVLWISYWIYSLISCLMNLISNLLSSLLSTKDSFSRSKLSRNLLSNRNSSTWWPYHNTIWPPYTCHPKVWATPNTPSTPQTPCNTDTFPTASQTPSGSAFHLAYYSPLRTPSSPFSYITPQDKNVWWAQSKGSDKWFIPQWRWWLFRPGRSFLSTSCIQRCWTKRWGVWCCSCRLRISLSYKIGWNISQLGSKSRLANTMSLSYSYTPRTWPHSSFSCTCSTPQQTPQCPYSTSQSPHNTPPTYDTPLPAQWQRSNEMSVFGGVEEVKVERSTHGWRLTFDGKQMFMRINN